MPEWRGGINCSHGGKWCWLRWSRKGVTPSVGCGAIRTRLRRGSAGRGRGSVKEAAATAAKEVAPKKAAAKSSGHVRKNAITRGRTDSLRAFRLRRCEHLLHK